MTCHCMTNSITLQYLKLEMPFLPFLRFYFRYTGHNIITNGVKEDDVNDVKAALKIFLEDGDDVVDMEKCKKLAYPKLKEFYNLHCRSRTYNFQVLANLYSH